MLDDHSKKLLTARLITIYTNLNKALEDMDGMAEKVYNGIIESQKWVTRAFTRISKGNIEKGVRFVPYSGYTYSTYVDRKNLYGRLETYYHKIGQCKEDFEWDGCLNGGCEGCPQDHRCYIKVSKDLDKARKAIKDTMHNITLTVK